MTLNEIHHLLSIALVAGIRASAAIMEVYNSAFGYDNKADGSPITIADRRSNQIITEALKTTGIPVISEESLIPAHSDRQNWEFFWLVDPLDGTKEFISRNGEFAINIALMQNNSPIAGIIISPVSGKVWWGVLGTQAFCIDAISLSGEINPELLRHISKPVKKQPAPQSIGISVSRSHMEPQTLKLAEQIRQKLGNVELVEKGSALKFCDLIEGRSHLYARYSPTWEWDTAAGHALLLAHGGEVFHITTHKPLQYNKQELGNPGFIAFASKQESVRYFTELSF
jgi:3'(2'), 5'-bisphosphate nucleotidase